MCGGLLLQMPAVAQKTFWSLFPTVIEFPAGTTSTLPGTLSNTTYLAENSVHLDGQLQFYVRNTYGFTVMDRFGTTYAPGNNTASGKELEIVPVPGSCDTYCVMFMESIFNATSKFAYFEVKVNTDGTLKVYDVKKKSTVYTDIVTGLAVSKRIGSSADRDIYVVAHTGVVDRYTISPSPAGIEFQETYSFTTSSNYSARLIYEADLSPDGLFLAWGGDDGDAYVLDLVNDVLHEIALPAVAYNQRVVGVEFHTVVEGGTSLYASMAGGGVYDIDDFAMATPTVTFVANSGFLGTSQLELALDGLIYAVNSSNGFLSSIDPLNNTVTTLNIPVSSSGGYVNATYALPQQIDGELDAAFYGVDPPSISGLSIDMTALPDQVGSAPTFFNCSPIGLGYNAGGDYDNVVIEIVSVNPLDGTPIYGTGFLDYAITLPNTTTLPIDLRCLDDAVNCDLFTAYLGQTFLLTVTLEGETCNTEASTSGFFEVFGAPSPITIDLDINSGSGTTCDADDDVINACHVGNKGGSFDISNSSGDIDYFRVTIQQVDCTTGADIGGVLLQGANTPFPSSGNANYNFNSLEINGSTGYFAENPVDGLCYRVEVTLGNVCGEASSLTYIFFDATLYLQGDGSNLWGSSAITERNQGVLLPPTSARIIPQPVQQQARLQLDTRYQGESILVIFNSNGQLLLQQNKEATSGQIALPVDGLLPGLYYYQLQLPDQLPITGKFVKQ
jgi:WD40 repeat protein